MLRWIADDALGELLGRYYRGEAGLWPQIRSMVDEELLRHGIVRGAFHIRFRKRADDRYDVIIDDATGYEVAP
jgi:hypothetical protein